MSFHAPGSLCPSTSLCSHAPLRVPLCLHLSAGDVHEDGKAGQMVALAADMALVAEDDFAASCRPAAYTACPAQRAPQGDTSQETSQDTPTLWTPTRDTHWEYPPPPRDMHLTQDTYPRGHTPGHPPRTHTLGTPSNITLPQGHTLTRYIHRQHTHTHWDIHPTSRGNRCHLGTLTHQEHSPGNTPPFGDNLQSYP